MTTTRGTSSSATPPSNIEQQPLEPALEVQNSPPQEEQNPGADQKKQKPKGKEKGRPLDVPQPFPTIPTTVSATGPRSAHREGKDMICTRVKLS